VTALQGRTSGLGSAARLTSSVCPSGDLDDGFADPLNGRSAGSKICTSNSSGDPAGSTSEPRAGVRPGAVGEDRPAARTLRRSRSRGRRSAHVMVRFYADAMPSIRAAAGERGLTVATFVAEVAERTAAGRPLPRVVSRERQALLQAVRALNRLHGEARSEGNNLNQLAKVANTTGGVPPELVDALERNAAVVADIRAALVALMRTTEAHGDQ
jgi:hypothetical protein